MMLNRTLTTKGFKPVKPGRLVPNQDWIHHEKEIKVTRRSSSKGTIVTIYVKGVITNIFNIRDKVEQQKLRKRIMDLVYGEPPQEKEQIFKPEDIGIFDLRELDGKILKMQVIDNEDDKIRYLAGVDEEGNVYIISELRIIKMGKEE